MKGITYFRLSSPYEGDVTKNCALDGYEVDNNFLTLEGRDIKSVYVEDDSLYINLMNGDTIKAKDAYKNYTKEITFDFDEERGVLTIVRNGEKQEISGFLTEKKDSGVEIASDGTVVGNGTKFYPIGISPLYRTGTYRPAIQLIDVTKGGKLPSQNRVNPGDRYVTYEEVSDYGYLYNYHSVKKIMDDLCEEGSAWRVPTKEDWDAMLNAVEPNECDRNHTSASSNRYLGRLAGKLLKSVDMWRLECSKGKCCNDDEDEERCQCHEDTCSPTYCGEYSEKKDCAKYPNRGLDKYGFRTTPAGYADDGEQYMYFGERGWFWTSSTVQEYNVYSKRFEYNKSTVYQDITPTNFFLSLRLVKDYNGSNFYGSETILGHTCDTILLPSTTTGSLIWTSVNVAFGNRHYCPHQPNDGHSLSGTKRYFVNEWDGQCWRRKEICEGESIVLFITDSGYRNVEYRVINGVLKDVSEDITDEIISKLTPKFDELGDRIDEVDTKVENEITRAKTREDELEEMIHGGGGDIQRLEEKVDKEISDRQEGDNALNEHINTVEGNLGTTQQELTDFKTDTVAKFESVDGSLNTLSEGLANEITRAKTREDELEEMIHGGSGDIQRLEEKINQEITDRQTADTAIEGKILTSDGTEFNANTGVLTLKSTDGTNDVSVQFGFDFGDI